MGLMKDTVKKKVNESTGTFSMALAIDPAVYTILGPVGSEPEGLYSVIEELVEEGEIVEIEYTLPGSNRVKSFLLPKGTDVRIRARFTQKEGV